MGEHSRELLFVYGTLMSNTGHPLAIMLREQARFLSEGTIRARLYHITDPDDPSNSYPGAVPSALETDLVFGEVYEIRNAPELLDRLDHFEACSPDWPEPHEFLRRRVRASLSDGASVWVSCYLYTWDVSGAERIASGRYQSRFSAQVR